MIHLRFDQTGPASGRIFIGDKPLAEIRDLGLINLRFGPGRKKVIGKDVPIPLYWQQYAHHENPERNGGRDPRIECRQSTEDELLLLCRGTNAGREIRSTCTLLIRYDAVAGDCVYDINAELDVLPGKGWRVTYNPCHGELEFCNFWPEGTFFAQSGKRKSFSTCFVQRGSTVTLIPHHHLESSDKHNIALRRGDRFGWLLEEENPVIQLLSNDDATAGLCAYMWDAHIAYRCCTAPGEFILQPGTHREASIRLTSLDKGKGTALLNGSVSAAPPDLAEMPIYTRGLNTFRENIQSFPGQDHDIWPWAFEVGDGSSEHVRGFLERRVGYDDTCSLCVATAASARGVWLATTLGPAYGEAPFRNKKRFRLTAMVRTELLSGVSRIGIRLHREGFAGLGDTTVYDYFWSSRSSSGSCVWTALEVITPAISPPPDRIHLMLDHHGQGTTWFDNVLFEETE